jgi:signal transduction histidine kinase
VRNAGRYPPARPGNGVVGMRERVACVHGRFHAGPTPDGWLVEATVPLPEAAA